MKITLDLSDLVGRGKLTAEEAERLKALASQETGSFGINILLAFGIVAIAVGAGVLVPSPYTAIVVGALLFALGMGLMLGKSEAWTLLARICTTIGALMVAGGVAFLYDASQPVLLAITLALAAAAVVSRSGLLAALSMLGIASALGGETGYTHALYRIAVPEPGLNVGVFSLLALVLASLRLPHAYERLAIIAARTAVLMVNLAFLVGSLWGDGRLQIPAFAFTIAWAVALLGTGIWGVMVNRRWVVNAAAVFGGLHFYTQWFELLGPNPLSVLGGGILLVVFGMALWSFNRRRMGPGTPAPGGAPNAA